jgi:transposase InsO family protein
MDFVMDALANARRIKCLTVVDDFSRECVTIAVDYGMGGQYVTRVLDQVGQFRGYPKAIAPTHSTDDDRPSPFKGAPHQRLPGRKSLSPLNTKKNTSASSETRAPRRKPTPE